MFYDQIPMALREQHGAPEGVGPPECDGGCAVHAPRRAHARRALLHRRRRPHLDLQGGDTWLLYNPVML